MSFVRASILEVKTLLARLTAPVSPSIRRPTIDKSLKLNPRPTSESRARIHIPIASSKNNDFRLSYVNHDNHVRLGKLLEDLDMLAGWIAYRHNSDQEYSDGTSPLTIVTACVDSVEIYKPSIKADQDLYMFGVVSWTGSSSMEITIHLTTDTTWSYDEFFENQNNDDNAILHSKFVMVARDHGADGKAARVFPLELSNDIERAIFNKGIENKQKRSNTRKTDLNFHPPTEAESAKIHEIYLSKLDKNSGSFTHFQKSTRESPYILMKDTSLKSCILCQPEYRNVHNKIFGGFLMRQAIELGEANFSLVFHENVPNCIDVADISFQAPVEIGSLLLLNSKILLTDGRKAVIRVHAQVIKPSMPSPRNSNSEESTPSSVRRTPKRQGSILDAAEIGQNLKLNSSYTVTRMENEVETTNVFYFIFESKASLALPEIMPQTYGESLLYIDGQRCLDRMYSRHADSSFEIGSWKK